MSTFRYALALLPLLVSGCATVGTGQFPAVSERDTQSLIESINRVSDEQAQAFRDFSARMMSDPDHMYFEWVQPENKSEPCKILMGQEKDQDTIWWQEPASQGTLYWDGECREGYAYGTGREFVTMPDGSLRSTLSTYSGGTEFPQIHLDVDYTNEAIVWSSNNKEKRADLVLRFEQRSPTVKSLVWSRYLTDASSNVHVTSENEVGNDFLGVSGTGENPNASVVLRWSVNPMTPYSMALGPMIEGKDSGYWIVKHVREGNMALDYTRSSTQPHRVTLPQSYIDYLVGWQDKMQDAMRTHDLMMRPAYAAIDRYKKRVCKGNVSVKWVADDIYGRICLPDGELTPFADVIAEKEAAQKERLENAGQQFAALQKQWAQERIAAQQAAAQAQAARSQAISQSIQQFNQSMQQFNQNATQYSQQFQNSIPAPTVNFGMDNDVQTHCIKTGNTVHCRSR